MVRVRLAGQGTFPRLHPRLSVTLLAGVATRLAIPAVRAAPKLGDAWAAGPVLAG